MNKLALQAEFDRHFASGVLCLARQEYEKARSYLGIAARTLSDLATYSTGDVKEIRKDWLFELIGQIKDLDKKIDSNSFSDKYEKYVREKNGTESDVTDFECLTAPNITFDDIAGLDDVKEAVFYKVIFPRKYPELYDTFKKKVGGGVLLFGLPGTGKTMIAKAIAAETGAKFYPVSCSDLGSKWFGKTEQNISNLFDTARKQDNAVIFFDEIEAYATRRREDSAMERVVPEFLEQMQGIKADRGNKILVIAATNRPWNIDSAFLRPGRFDEKIYVPLPDSKAREKILHLQLVGAPCAEDIDFDKLTALTAGFNGADIEHLCDKAKEFAIKKIIDKQETEQIIRAEDFSKALEVVSSSVMPYDIDEMNKWLTEKV